MNATLPPCPKEGECELGHRGWEAGLPAEAGLPVVGAQSVRRPEDLPARGQAARRRRRRRRRRLLTGSARRRRRRLTGGASGGGSSPERAAAAEATHRRRERRRLLTGSAAAAAAAAPHRKRGSPEARPDVTGRSARPTRLTLRSQRAGTAAAWAWNAARAAMASGAAAKRAQGERAAGRQPRPRPRPQRWADRVPPRLVPQRRTLDRGCCAPSRRSHRKFPVRNPSFQRLGRIYGGDKNAEEDSITRKEVTTEVTDGV
ncbi:serine/arginine repetitive matrix protein 3-like [Felis catus]|uniref:serine/arginine repetitive matrix protein 3-like n=1 Tax=Felis catus TaxID=9685 RepID=UPI001D19D903|nr:serine/arginine repetitive matrix protein 3-like [Felis catus]